jgi:hypothetical protein
MPSARAPQFSSRSFIGSPYRVLSRSVGVALLPLTVLVLLGVPTVVAAGALFLTLMFMVGTQAGDVTYTITDAGLHIAQKPLLSVRDGPPTEQTIPWEAVRSVQHKEDLNRSFHEERQVRLRVSGAPHRIWISDRNESPAFDAFCTALDNKVAQINAERALRETGAIAVKPDFYDRPVAWVVFGVFVVMTVGLLAATAAGMLRTTNLLRVGLIILPGVAYMGYRLLRAKASA